MKVIKYLSLIALTVTTIFLTGCSDSPNAVAEKWANAIVDGDVSRANKYSVSNSAEANGILILMFQGMDSNEKAEQIKQMKTALKKTAEIDGNDAIISNGDFEFKLRKVDGNWKVVVDK